MGAVKIRLIGTTDLHAYLHPYDYYRDAPDPAIGLAKAATLIAAARRDTPNSLLFDNGDLIQGAPLADWAAESLQSGAIAHHPMIGAMNALGYDGATLGNHEYNYGLEVLEAAITGAQFPIVNCNVLKPDGGLFYTPWTILTRDFVDEQGALQTLRIGLIGFVTPQILRWDRQRLAGRVLANGIVDAARTHVPALRAAGADVVVALCHSGVARKPSDDSDENAGLELAAVPGIDAIFVGHQHLSLPGPDFADVPGVDAERGRLGATPACMAGCFGRQIGTIDLDLAPGKNGWQVTDARVTRAEVTAATAADERVLTVTAAAHQGTLAYVRAPVGEISAALASYFAMIGDDPSVRIVNDAQLWRARDLAAQTSALREAPILSAAAPFKCGGRYGPDFYTRTPRGAVSLRHIADLYVYPNTFSILRVTGQTLREWLERAASVFRRIDPGLTDPQPLLDPLFVPYDFDHIAGVTYQLDLTQPARYDDQGRVVSAGARVLDLCFEGQPVADGAPFLIATNSYRANGGGRFPGCDGTTTVYAEPEANRDVLRDYVRRNSPVSVSTSPGWRLAPWPASVCATLAAPRDAAMAPPPEVTVAPFGANTDGFQLYRVTPIP